MSSINAREYEKQDSVRVAFLGLGVMGFPMAGHLAKAGHEVTVYNRSTSKAEAWVAEFGGKSAPTPREAAANAQVVFCCVGNDDDLRSVVLGKRCARWRPEPRHAVCGPHYCVCSGRSRVVR